MKCLNEFTIDRLAVMMLEKKDIRIPEYNHIPSCSVCKDRLDHAITLLSNSVYSAINIDKSKIHTALPIHIPSTTIVNGPTLLAADNSDKTNLVEKAICVLSTNDGSTLVRLIRNTKSQESTIHILSEDSSNYKHVLLTIDGFSGEWVTNDHGIASLGNIQIPSPESLKVNIISPLTTIKLDAVEWTSTHSLVKEIDLGGIAPNKLNFSIIPVNEDYQLRIHLSHFDQIEESSDKIKIMVVKEKKVSKVSPLDNGVAIFENINIDEGISINIYH